MDEESLCWVLGAEIRTASHGSQDLNWSTSVRRRAPAADEEIQKGRDSWGGPEAFGARSEILDNAPLVVRARHLAKYPEHDT